MSVFGGVEAWARLKTIQWFWGFDNHVNGFGIAGREGGRKA